MDGSKSKFYLESLTETVLEGESFEVYLIRKPDPAYKHLKFGAWWHTDAGYADENDYVALPGESEYIQWSTDSETQANRQARTVYTIDDDKVEDDEHFWVRFTPTDNVSDPNHPSRDEKCRASIRDNDPHVTKIEMVSAPARGDTYGLGETIEFSATFNNPVDVDGYVVMGFWMGGQWRGGLYQRGSGTDTLVFAYTVQPEDLDDDGIKVHDGYIHQDGRRHGFGGSGDIFIRSMPEIQGVDGFPVNKLYRGIPDQPGHKVDGSLAPFVTDVRMASTPAEGNTYRLGESIEIDVAFSAPVEVSGEPALTLWTETGDRSKAAHAARYQSGSGTRTLTFALEVPAMINDANGLTIGIRSEDGLGLGSITAVGTGIEADQSYHEQRNLSGHKVAGRSSVANVAITSSPARGGNIYGQGEHVEFTVSFDQIVEVVGDVKLRLDIDYTEDAPNYAIYDSGSGTNSLVFKYEVAPMDYDPEGIGIIPSDYGLFWGDGTVKAEGSGADLDTTYPGIENLVGPEVTGGSPYHDTTAPRVLSVSIVSDAGDDKTYVAGDQITVAVTFNERVSVYGDLKIGLEIGKEERTASFWDRSSIEAGANRLGAEPTVLLAYTVQKGDLDDDGISIGPNKFDLNGGSIWDKSGNYATNPTHPALSDDGNHLVEAPYGAGQMAALTADEPISTTVLLSHTLLDLEEGESATYTVALSSQPSDDVMVNITRTPHDLGSNAPLALPFLTMNFTPDNWNVPQEVTVVAERDADHDHHLIYLSHTAHGGGYHLEHAEMSVVIKDSDG